MDKLKQLRDFAQALIDEGNREEREVGRAGAHEAITVRGICERVIADLDAVPVLTEKRAREVIRTAIDHSRYLPHGQAEYAIATRVAKELAGLVVDPTGKSGDR